MTDRACFHDFHGPNIALSNDNTEAKWRLSRSGGCVFTEDPLHPGDTITVTCEGSGRVQVGCTSFDPLRFKTDIPDSVSQLEGFELMNEMRFHRRGCNVNFYLNRSGETITSSCGFLKYDKVVHRKQPMWIVMYIVHGEVKITAKKHDGTNVTLSISHGKNVVLNDERTNAIAVNESPGSMCLMNKAMRLGDNVYLNCQPILVKGRAASNYYVKLMISQQSPEHISRKGFTLTDICIQKPPLTVVETLRKDDCKGEIRISLLQDNRLEYRSANSKVNSQSLWTEPLEGVWLYLELYRVQIQCSTDRRLLHAQPDDCVRGEMSSLPSRRRNESTYQYNHVTCGSHGRTYPIIAESETAEYIAMHSDTTEYVDMSMGYANAGACCPVKLDKVGIDSVDGIFQTLNSLDSKVNTINQRVGAIANELTCGSLMRKDSRTKEPRGQIATVQDDRTELRNAIQKNWNSLINCLQTEVMADLLFENGVVSHTELDKIRRRVKLDGQEANRQILDILYKRGICKDLLIKILQTAGDNHLVDLLFKT